MTSPPISRLLHQAGGIRVHHRPGDTDWTLVVFGPRQADPGDDRWWGSGLGRREKVDMIGVSSTAYDWFPRDVMATLVPVIRAAAKPAVVTYGFSMGGYGALKYASAVGSRAVLALSAQYSIDPADGTTGERGMTYFDPGRHRDMRVMPGDYPDGALLLWDPEVVSDDRHARAIARLPGIRPVKLRLAGHATPAIFSETGRLMPVVEALLAGRHDDAIASIRAARREAPTVLLAVSALLQAHGHHRWAAQAQRRAQQSPVNEGRAIEARARAFARLGDAASEIAALRDWVTATPQDLEPRLRLVGRLMALGRPAEAAEAARQSIEAGLADDRLRAALREAEAAVRAAQTPAVTVAAPAAQGGRATRPAPELLGETESIRLWHWPGQGPGTLVLFTPPANKPSGPADWWGQGQATRLGWSTIVFAAHRPTWYPAQEMAQLLPLVRAAMPAGPSITYGLGMGGYAALKHGDALGADATLALSPAYSIDPADMPGDARAIRVFDPKRNAGMAVRPADLSVLPIIAYDPLLRQDAAQARRLAAMHRVRAVPMHRAGQGVAAMLIETAQLVPVLTAALAGDAARAVNLLRSTRRMSPTLRGATATALDAAGHGAWAKALRARHRPPVAPEVGRRFGIQARALRAQRKYDAETVLLRQWIDADPQSVQPRVQLATCLQLLGRYDAAARSLLDAVSDGVRDDWVLATFVRMLGRVEPTAAAVQAMQSAVAAMPRDADTLALTGEIHLWAGQPSEADAAFLSAVERRRDHPAALRGLAVLEPLSAEGVAGPRLASLVECLSTSNATAADWLCATDRLWAAERIESAIQTVTAAQQRHPQALALKLRQGRILLAAGQDAAAVACFEAAVTTAPHQALSWYGLGDALMALRRHEDGRKAMARAAPLHPQDAIIATRHAAFLLALDDGVSAEREARRAIALDAANEGGHLILIDALRRQHRHRDAIRAAREALAGKSGGTAIAMRLGRLLLDAKDAGGAAEIFARVTEAPSPPLQAWVALAGALDAGGRVTEAEDAARRGLLAHPQDQELQSILAQMLLSRGEPEAARDALAEATKQEAASPAVSLAMADAWLRQGRRREALQLLMTAVEESPGHSKTELRLGQLLIDEGRIDEAAAMFARVLDSEPGSALAWVGLSDVERLRKRVKPALEAYRRAVALGADAQTVRALRFRLFGEYDG